jgi:hypothetical protein
MNKHPVGSLALLALSLAALSTAAVADDRRPSPVNRFAARLQSVQEVPAVSSVASGGIVVTIDEGAQTISYELEFAGLEAAVAQAHIHTAQPGVNGGIMVWLCGTAALPGPVGTPVCPAVGGTLTGLLTPLQVVGPAAQGISAGEFAEVVAAIRAGVAYANVHSAKFPGGEIRGQLYRAPRMDRKDD